MATAEQQALDFNPELQDVSRQRKLAELLMAQGFNQPQGQMISGHYVAPSWTQQLNPMANILAGQAIGEKADVQQTKLAEALRTQGDAAARDIMQTYQQNPQAALAKATQYQQFPQVKALLPQLAKVAINEPTSDVQNFQYAQQNPAFAQYQTGLKRAGAPTTMVSMGKSIAGEIGPMMKEAQGIAQAAVKTEDSANRIIQAVDSNKLYSGTAANVRLGAAQLADTLGVGGKDLQTKIGNTRQAMQGLAELTLQGRQQMRGQGAITESESKLAERAISGDITFTPTEIKQLANAAKRVSDYTYRTYETKLGEMAKNPETAGLVPYYQVPRMTQPTMTETTDTGGWSVKKVK